MTRYSFPEALANAIRQERAIAPTSRSAWLTCTAAIAVAFFGALAWGALLPTDGAGPDEPAHMEVVDYIAEHWKLPDPVSDERFQPRVIGIAPYTPPLPWPIEGAQPSGPLLEYPYVSYASMPPGPYVASAAATLLPGSGTERDTRQARVPQSLWAGILVLAIFLLARVALPHQEGVAVLAASIAATWPRSTFTSAYVNNDAFTTMACALLVWRWWVVLRSGPTTWNALALGAALGAIVIGKPNGWIIAAFTLPVLVVALQGSQLRRVLGFGAIAGLTSVAVAAPWLWVAVRRYGVGDILGRADAKRLIDGLPHSDLSAASMGLGYVEMLRTYWISNFSRSFYTFVQLDTSVFVALSMVLFVAAFGLVFRVLDAPAAWHSSRREVLMHVLTSASVVSVLAAASVNSYRNDAWFGEQGRYLMPGFAVIATYLAVGTVAAGTTPRRRRFLAIALLGVLLLGAAMSFDAGLRAPHDAGFTTWETTAMVAWIVAGTGLATAAGWYLWRGSEPARVPR